MKEEKIKINGNKIVLGDCFKVLKRIDDIVDFIITDPPQYRLINDNIEFNTRKSVIRKVEFDNFSNYQTFILFTALWIKLCSKILKDNGVIGIFYAEIFSNDLIEICNKYELEYFDTFYWHKINPMPQVRKRNFVSSVETCLFFVKNKRYTFNFLGQNDMHDFMELPICAGKERLKDDNNETLHPTQKPIKLIEHFIKIFTNSGEKVVDPFSGTGTTNIACKCLNRNCLGIEKNQLYHKKSIKRLNNVNISKSGVLKWLE